MQSDVARGMMFMRCCDVKPCELHTSLAYLCPAMEVIVRQHGLREAWLHKCLLDTYALDYRREITECEMKLWATPTVIFLVLTWWRAS